MNLASEQEAIGAYFEGRSCTFQVVGSSGNERIPERSKIMSAMPQAFHFDSEDVSSGGPSKTF